jgi:prepilin-type N-terminal cleavage/methylation domain-containing protein
MACLPEKGRNRVLNRIRSDKDHKNLIEQGFTLVELLIVIVILGILAGIVVFAVGNLTSNAKTNACATEKSSVTTAAEAYKAQMGVYPTAAVAGAGKHAIDLLTGANGVTPPAAVGTLLKTVPASYTIDDAGAGTVSAISGNAAGCA